MQSIVELDAEICMTGTFYHYSDLYNKIIRENQFSKNEIHIRRAIENGKVLYKSWFRMKDLMKIKQRQGNYIFNCQYLLNPIPKEDQFFPPPHPTYTQLPADTYSYYIAVDPAGTTESYSDFTAITIAAVNKIKRIYIEESVQLKKSGDEIADYLIMKCLQYTPESVGIELGVMTYLRQIIETRRSEYERKHQIKVPMNIKPIPISRKLNKATRVNLTLGSFMRTGHVLIKDTCKELLTQLEFFTGKGKEKDDLVDSASMLFAIIEGYAVGMWYEPQRALGPGDLEWWFKPKNKTWRDNFANAS